MSGSLQTIVLTISQYLNCAVLPLTGKQPRFAWAHLQKQQPSTDEINNWFSDPLVTSYGIIMGQVSNGLIGLDFDQPEQYEHFCTQFPHIAKSFTVQTRRGHHIYLRANFPVQTRKCKHGELQAEGSYLVGPGSIISNNHQDTVYTIHRSDPVYSITQHELNAVLTYLRGAAPQAVQVNSTNEPMVPTEQRIIRHYQQQAPQVGRNNALYTAASYAKRAGICINETIGSLATLHAHTAPFWEHTHETQQQRYKEAIATIHSAYKASIHSTQSRPVQHNQTQTIRELIPNSIREALIQINNGSTIPGRLIEALYKEGWQPGQHITMKDAQACGQQYHIGDHSTRAAVTGKYSALNTEQKLFPPAGEGDKTAKNSTGRKPAYFIVPSIEYLAQALDVVPLAADPLTVEDLCSPARYRAALHRTLIQRTEPEAPAAWHAQRLGVSTRTIRRYNAQLSVICTPVYGYTPLTWDNVDNPDFYRSPEGKITPGLWLQREDGKRFPAVKGIALRQLAKGAKLVACQQLPSRYQLPDRALILPEVIWRRLDLPQPDWGGGKHDFPPTTPAPAKYIPKIIPIASEGVTDSTHDVWINHNLTLVKGIGQRRAEKLNRAGIHTLEELIAAGAERLANMNWPGGYVTLRTTTRWIEGAEILLGRRDPDPEIENKRQKQSLIRSHRRYLEKLIAWEDSLFGTGDIWRETEHVRLMTKPESSHWYQSAQTFLTQYLERVEMFLAMDAAHLQRYVMGDHKSWQKMKRLTVSQLE